MMSHQNSGPRNYVHRTLHDHIVAKLEARVADLEAELEELKAASRIECPCCGKTAAEGMVSDGDALLCGCDGAISVDGEYAPYANAYDCECGGYDGKRVEV